MKYFETLPKVSTIDYSGNKILMTNLMVRSEIVPSLLKNPLLFYSYNIKDGDSPEIIATKYYDDSYRYWIVLFANQIIDPEWDWPMNSALFGNYIFEKYKAEYAKDYDVPVNSVTPSQVIPFVQAQTQNYVKSVTTIDNTSGKSNTINYFIDYIAYSLVDEGTLVRNFPTGQQVTQITTKYIETYYDYEERLNEARRSIFLVNAKYVSEFELQFYNLMKM